MICQALSPDEAIAILNELLACDPRAMHALTEHRSPCNKALADHPTAQVVDQGGQPCIGLLGVLNALFGVLGPEAGRFEGYGIIQGVYNDQGKLIGFARTDPGLPDLKTRPAVRGAS